MRHRPLALSFLVLAACKKPAPPSTDEADRMLHAVEAVQETISGDGTQRRALLEALERQPAEGREALRARDTCAAAFRLLFDGDDVFVKLRARMADGAVPGPDAERDIGFADEKISAARAMMPSCEEALATLRARSSAPRPPGSAP